MGVFSTLRGDPPFPNTIENVQRALDVVEVSVESEFLALERDWNIVAQVSQHRSIFLRHEWFVAAWAWKKMSARLHILVARRGPCAVRVLPLIHRSNPASRVVESE